MSIDGGGDEGTSSSSPPRSPPPPRSARRAQRSRGARRRWIKLGVVVVVLGWLALAALQILAARRAASDGIARLDAFKASLTPAELIRGRGLDKLRTAERDFASAGRHIGSPLVAPFRFVPIVGRQVRSVDALTNSAKQVIAAGTSALDDARRDIHGHQSDGPGRVTIVSNLGAIADRTTAHLRPVDLGPSQALIGPIARARDKFSHELDRLRTGLHKTSIASRGMLAFMRGPTHYLVLAANNAEMRSGSGMWLSAGELTVDNGSFSVDHMQATSELTLDPKIAPPIADADIAARWGWLAPNREWRNLAASARFGANAQLAAAMWKARTGQTVDGVLVLDPVALKAVLSATGPVQVDGLTLDRSNVVDEILRKQYRDFPIDASQTAAHRHEILSDAASAVLKALDGRKWDVATLVDELAKAARGRHVLAWSSDPDQQAAWSAAGVDGALQRDAIAVSILSQGGNKLDQWIEVSGEITTSRSKTGSGVTIDLSLSNHAPFGEPQYVAGPTDQLPEGSYAGILSINVPAYARDVQLEGKPTLVAAGTDGASQVVATRVQLARDQKLHFRLQFTLPSGATALHIEPSARVPEVYWKYRAMTWYDDRIRSVSW